MRQYINSAFNDLGMGVSAIASFPRGFVVGSENGHMAIWVRADEGDRNDDMGDEGGVSFLKRWHTERKSGVASIDISSSEELIAVAFCNNDIATIEMS